MGVPGTDLRGWRWLQGRANRREFWLWTFAIAALSAAPSVSSYIVFAIILGWALPLQMIRRLHDVGQSGWWVAGMYVAYIGLVGGVHGAGASRATSEWAGAAFIGGAMLIMGSWPGNGGDNRFGPKPRWRRRRLENSSQAREA